ncbi:MAG: methionyl-tRNA formyltransferase [Gloeobacteraceae cyanobacterium ES-bin-144]|nr:methionyl-tRNA formyltransferase [Verrucomicrobiales bacterium]
MDSNLRLVFVATGDIALPAFRYLLRHGPRPLALVTQPDKPVGRHQTMTPPAIKNAAIEAGIPVFQPEKIGNVAAELSVLSPDIVVVMAYGQILRKDILTLAGKAIINLHASLLPKYRGAACIQAAIDAGESVTGITSMHVVRELDAGDVILAKTIAIAPDETGGTLHDRLAELAALVLSETLTGLANGSAERIPQDTTLASYVSKLERDDGRLDWRLTASDLERRIRAYDPWPGTFTTVIEGTKEKRLKIFPPTMVSDRVLSIGEILNDDGMFLVGCGTGALQLSTVQPEGSKRMSAADYHRGRSSGAVFS